MAQSIIKLAEVLSKNKKNICAYILYKIAVFMQERICKKREQLFEDDLIRSYESFGGFADKLKFKKSAAVLYIKAIKVRKKQSEKNPLKYENQLAIDLNSLGKFYKEWGKDFEAIECYARSIQIREEAYKKNGAYRDRLAVNYNDLALYLYNLKRYDEAETFYIEAINLNLEIGKERDVSLVINYYNMGLLYYKKGDAEKEVEYFKKALYLYRELAKENPQKYNEKVTKTEECLKNAEGRLKEVQK